MGEEGSEEEVERSFEEEFASVVAPGEVLEEVLKSLDEELQEGNWRSPPPQSCRCETNRPGSGRAGSWKTTPLL